MGSDWRIAFWKSESADGVARRLRTMVAPLLCPAIVTEDGLPPKEAMFTCMNFKALIASLTAKFIPPPGAKNPSY
jgi:hypothetical protein